MNLETAKALIAPYEREIIACFHTAWSMWKDLLINQPDKSKPIKPRTRANYVNDCICDEIKKRFSGLPFVTISEPRGFLMLTIEDGINVINIRFKKLNKKGRTANIRTRQQIELFDKQLELTGLSPGIRVTAGYSLDPTQSEIIEVSIVYEKSRALVWRYALDGGESIVALPLPFEEPAPTRRVKAKEEKRSVKSANGQ